ncbi:putative metal-nicotianamine transporter YSL9 [Platanthera guangdongensis]|uniref:Metal-nicotianamine transporter YSL9 n=1 Tax=Platanthera guangdongensis TaxID=2320717 RepID=A0ABR2MQI7_9ASPA
MTAATHRAGSKEIREVKAGEDLEEDTAAAMSGNFKLTPHWSDQLTVRGVVVSSAIGSLYSIIVMKLNLTTGLVPTLNVSAALLTFVILKTWTKILGRAGFISKPLTRQESTVAQTCAVAAYTIAYGGGFGSYLLGLNKKTYEQAGVGVEGNVAGSYKEPGIGWMTGFSFSVSFVGILILVPLRKMLIIDNKLPYPSGTATAVLINGFHTSKGDKMAQKQVRGFMKYFTLSFIWSFFQWFFSGGETCGFAQFPTFGLTAYRNTFFFDFSLTYIGAGMICSHIVNISLILGAVLSWGVMSPLLKGFEGDWFPSNIPHTSMKSLQGYKVFLTIALLLGDGLYNFVKIMYITFRNMLSKYQQKNTKTVDNMMLDELERDEVFARETMPPWLPFTGYAVLVTISVIAIPHMFPQVKWYYVIFAYTLAPVLGFCNAYGTGLTDMNMAYNYGKVLLFIVAAWSGNDSGVVAGLVVCGVIKSAVYMSADLMHDFKTGHLTHTSPRSMLVSQIIGTAIGCVTGPLSFFLFYKAFDVGNPDGVFKAPYALVYRNIAVLAVQGFSTLPRHCLQLCCGFFGFAVAANVMKDLLPARLGRWVPLPMAMAFPFLVGANFAIDMFVGTVVVFVWRRVSKEKAAAMIPAVASGFICGDGLWVLPSSILALLKVRPPLCMMFVHS